MIRILQIVSSLAMNGTETFIINLFRNIDRSQVMFDFLVLSTEKKGFYYEIISLGGNVFFLPKRKDGIKSYNKALDAFFRQHAKDYDAVHYNVSSLTSVAPLIYARKYGIATRIVHCHNANCTGIHNRLFHRINRFRINRLATHFLACSSAAAKWGYSFSGKLPETKVITNGITLSKFTFNKEIRTQFRKALGISDKMVVLHVGTFNPIKNHSFLIDIFKEIKAIRQDAMLISVGEGELLQHTKEKTASLGIEQDVIFLGRRADVANIMMASDVMVFPSLHEGLGIVVIEALAASLPCLVSTGVPQEVNISDKIKFLPLSEGPQEWAKQAISLASTNRGESTDDRLSAYSIENTVRQMEKIYFSIPKKSK